MVGTKGVPSLVTHDARTIRYPDPLIKVNDTVRIDLETGKITEFIKFDTSEERGGYFLDLMGFTWKPKCVDRDGEGGTVAITCPFFNPVLLLYPPPR